MRHLREIRIVTHCVADLEHEISVWREYLGYRLLTEGTLSAELCAAWGTEQEENKAFAIMQPASGAQVYMRFIATGNRPGYWPPVTWGWNATEILVTDPDELASLLDGSPIERFGGPGDLYMSPKAPRAIQTLGPSGAMLYFTRILPGGSRYGLHGAKSPVDRVFNVVLGGPSLDKLCSFYSEQLGLRVGEPMGFTMTLAAQACGAPPETEFPICVAPLRVRHSILELDEYPQNSAPRPREQGHLPGGMSMVSFDTPSIEAIDVSQRRAARAISEFPYEGRRCAVIEGPAGEWLELIETN
jgi:catechol 2,3-dioxygenase-like lactoylglutathione lyase family enzyme